MSVSVLEPVSVGSTIALGYSGRTAATDLDNVDRALLRGFRESGAADGDDSDPALLVRLRDSDASALNALVRRYWRPLVAYASDLLGCPDAGEDLAQEAFVRLWDGRHRIACDRTLAPYLYRIVRNLVLNEERHRQVRLRLRQQVGDQLPQASSPTPLDTLSERELGSAVEGAIEALSPRRREVFLLVRVHALSYREIGERLDLSPQTVANQMSGALRSLRQSLGEYLE